MTGNRLFFVVGLVLLIGAAALIYFWTQSDEPGAGSEPGSTTAPAATPREPARGAQPAASGPTTAGGAPAASTPEGAAADAAFYLELELLLPGDRTYTGWVKEGRLVEIYDASSGGFRQKADTPENRALPGAGLTLLYVGGHRGMMFVAHEDIRQLTVLRRLVAEEAWKLWAVVDEAESGAYDILRAARSEQMISRGRKLFEKFPPGEWNEERFLKLRRAKIDGTRELDELELEFLRVYVDLWKPAFEAEADPAGTRPK